MSVYLLQTRDSDDEPIERRLTASDPVVLLGSDFDILIRDGERLVAAIDHETFIALVLEKDGE